MKSKIFILFILFAFMTSSGFGCKLMSEETREALEPVTLEYWRVWDNYSDFKDIIATYQTYHPNVRINYRKFRYEEYEQALLEAFAAGKGPDIFSIHNDWIKSYQEFIQPMPQSITLPYKTLKGTIKKQEVVELVTKPTMSLSKFKDTFPEVVSGDVIISTNVSKTSTPSYADLVYGMPLSLDTMVLFYNKDILNNANISYPPESWTELQQDVVKITKIDEQGNILISGAALGTGENIDRSSDILAVLMMQNETEMTDSRGYPIFNEKPKSMNNRTTSPGMEALNFYTDFASPIKEVYSWSQEMQNSIDEFALGKVGFMLGYSYMIEQIETKSPKLNYGIAPLPQISGLPVVNYANYWVETVSNKTPNINEAWDFVIFSTSKDQVTKYLNQTQKPTALRSLIDTQLQDEELSIFVSQILTSKNWYQGEDVAEMEEIFKYMIDTVVTGEVLPQDAIDIANNRVKQTMQVKKSYEN